MSKGYCDPADVANYLGRTLTQPQQNYVGVLLDATEEYIDRETRQLCAAGYGGWELDPITDEEYSFHSSHLRLRYFPVTSIQQIRYRTIAIGETPIVLTAGTDYELLNPSTGWVQFQPGWAGHRRLLLVDYTPNRPVPADITLAAAKIIGHTMLISLFPDRLGVDDAQVDAQTNISYSKGALTLHIPESAKAVIDSYAANKVIIA